jgi:hypothetical protein
MQVIRQGNQNSLFPASKLPPYNAGVVSTQGLSGGDVHGHADGETRRN